MRTIKVALREDESVTVEPAVAYMGEHRALRLEISLPQRLRTGFDYYTLGFDQMDKGTRVPIGNIYPGSGGAAYYSDGTIHCVLPGRLTHCSFVRVQVEAHRQEGGRCAAIEKSASFVISFEGGLSGDGDTLQAFALGHINEIMAQIDAARKSLETTGVDAETLRQVEQLVGELAQAELSAVSAELARQVQESMQGALNTVAGKIDATLAGLDFSIEIDEAVKEAFKEFEFDAELLQELQELKETIGTELSELQDRLMEWMEENLETALSGIGVQNVAVSQGGTVTLLPGIRYRINILGTALHIVLDDTEASPEFAQEFSFVADTVAGVPQVSLAYLSGHGIHVPPGLFADTGKIYEVNVLDSLALVAEWEAA